MGIARQVRSFAHASGPLAGVAFALMVTCCSGLALAARPNVLFIAVDDLRPELGCYGSPALSPNIDGLAASGLQFDRAYCNQAVCGASRVCLMTGLYPEYTGERNYHVTDWRQRWADVVTLNQHFSSNGYQTVGLGKVYHSSGSRGADNAHWTQWLTVDGKEYADPESLRARRESPPRNGRRRGPATEAADVGDESHFDGNRAKLGAEKLRALAASNQPFFLAVGFTKPHLPFVAPKKYWDLYRREAFSLPKNLGVPPGYPSFAANVNAGELRNYSDIPTAGAVADFPQSLSQRLIHGYFACVSYLDRNVGVLLHALEESGAANNTIVVFWADHGWKLGDHSSWCKHTNFECDTRVPLIIRAPQVASARGRTNALAELVDLYPTLCELCDLELPPHLQGKSFAPVLQDPRAAHRAFAYSSYPHNGGRGIGRVVGHSLRNDRYRYTEWWNAQDEAVDAVLTDLAEDPHEVTAVEGRVDLKRTLAEQLRARVLSVRK